MHFSIQDTGIGIPKDRLGELFSPFRQVDGSATRKYGGTGLGLAISKQLVQIMGGEIGVKSVVNSGSEFWFKVEFRKLAAGAQPENQQTNGHLAGARILIVDDHEYSRLQVMTHLRAWGCYSTEASNGEEALRLMGQAVENGEAFQVVIVDEQMPGMDGYEFTCRTGLDPRLQNTPLILLTSLGNLKRAGNCEEGNFSRILHKPLRQGHLKTALVQILSGQVDAPPVPEQKEPLVKYLAQDNTTLVHILLVEDNQINQTVAMEILKKLGYRADAVGNGIEALQALRRIPYDLVLMDCQMPEMDGFQATEAIRDPVSGVINPMVPIVALTAHAMQGDRERCLACGMNDFLSKPIQSEKLAKTLDMWLNGTPEMQKNQQIAAETTHAEPAGPAPERGTATGTVQVFDEQDLMHRLMDDRELAIQIVEAYLEDVPHQIEMLRKMIVDGDAQSVRRQGHTLKGASSNLGAPAMRKVALEMEKYGERGELVEAEKHLQVLLDELDRLKVELKKKKFYQPD